MDVLNVHKVFSEEIKKCQALPNNAGLTLFRLLRGAKKEIVRLFIVFTENSAAPESEPRAVAEGFLPPVMDTILADYHSSAPGVRDAEVLALFAVLVNKLQSHILPSIPRVIEAVLESSLQMISHNFEDYPELRLQFFRFIQVRSVCCTRASSSVFSPPPFCSGRQPKLFRRPFPHPPGITEDGCRLNCLGVQAHGAKHFR